MMQQSHFWLFVQKNENWDLEKMYAPLVTVALFVIE